MLTETPALLAYIAQRYPAAGLAPLNDPFAFARLQEFNAYLCATFHDAHGHLWQPQRWVSDPAAMEEIKRAAPVVIAACWSYLENHAFRGPWAMGDSYTICDPYLYTVTSWRNTIPLNDRITRGSPSIIGACVIFQMCERCSPRKRDKSMGTHGGAECEPRPPSTRLPRHLQFRD